MAYKFQLGNARLGGQVSATSLDAQDANVTNVGEIAVDKIEADGSRLHIDVANSQANAVVISGSASGEMMKISTLLVLAQFMLVPTWSLLLLMKRTFDKAPTRLCLHLLMS